MSVDLRLGDHSFSLMERGPAPEGSVAPLTFVSEDDRSLPIGLFLERPVALLNAMDDLKTEVLWFPHQQGFSGLFRPEHYMAANTAPTLNTRLHTHPGSELLMTAALERDCSRAPFEHFKFSQVENLVRDHWEEILSLFKKFRTPENRSSNEHERQIWKKLFCFWSSALRALRDFKDCPDFSSEKKYTREDWCSYLTYIFSCLHLMDADEARSLFAAERALKPDFAVHWYLPKTPSVVVFRGFHRGGVQAEDPKASVYHRQLLDCRMPR